MEQIDLFGLLAEVETVSEVADVIAAQLTPEQIQEVIDGKATIVFDSQLDPCPKCHRVPDMRSEIDTQGTRSSLSKFDERSEPTGKQLYSVDCKTCYIPDPGANAFTYNVFFTPEEAAEHWHQRVETVKEKTT